jgi:hypothetical protein
MPKFLTYQRPAPVKKDHWNGASQKPAPLPRKVPVQAKPTGQIELPSLDKIIRKQ